MVVLPSLAHNGFEVIQFCFYFVVGSHFLDPFVVFDVKLRYVVQALAFFWWVFLKKSHPSDIFFHPFNGVVDSVGRACTEGAKFQSKSQEAVCALWHGVAPGEVMAGKFARE